MNETSSRPQHWSGGRMRRLRNLYPTLHPEKRTGGDIAVLAHTLGVSPQSVVSAARRNKISRAGATMPLALDVDREGVLRYMTLRARTLEEGLADAARALSIPLAQARVTWERLERQRRARIGEWSERDLCHAVERNLSGDTPESVAVALARHPDDVRVKLSCLGVLDLSGSDNISLAEAARILGCHVSAVVEHVQDGLLSMRCDNDQRVVTSRAALGALLRTEACASRPQVATVNTVVRAVLVSTSADTGMSPGEVLRRARALRLSPIPQGASPEATIRRSLAAQADNPRSPIIRVARGRYALAPQRADAVGSECDRTSIVACAMLAGVAQGGPPYASGARTSHSLADAALLLGRDIDDLIDLVDEGSLSAQAPADGSRFADSEWLTDDRRLAALIVARPDCWDAVRGDVRAVVRLAYVAGMSASRAAPQTVAA